MKKKILLACLLSSSVALACQVIDGSSFDLNIGEINPANISSYGDAIQRSLGARFGSNVQVEGTIRYQARIPFVGLVGGVHSIPLTKYCNQTFKQRWTEIYNAAPPSWSGGGSGFYFPRFPNIPGGCVGNCGGTVTVGEVIPT